LADSTPRLQGAAGQPAALLQATDALLLAWLALEGPTPRERLAELLWPDKDASSSRNALRQRLFRLRRTAGHPLLRGSAVLELHPDVQHDLHASATILGAMQPPLHGELDNWLAAQRASRQAGVRRGLEERIQALESGGDYAHALPLALTLLQAHPHSEDAHRRVIRLHYLRGDRAAALLAFDRCEHVLKHDVGATPSLETLELLATIEQQDVVDRTPVRFGRVPLALQRPPRLIGRSAEIDTLRRAWRAGSHTMVLGIPGLGRTRLLEWVAQHEPGALRITLPHDTSGWPMAAARRIVSALMRQASPALKPDLARQIEALLDPSGSRRPLQAQSMADAHTLQIEELVAQWSAPVAELL
jgi:DNA-binding SARP family transcriptional activator